MKRGLSDSHSVLENDSIPWQLWDSMRIRWLMVACREIIRQRTEIHDLTSSKHSLELGIMSRLDQSLKGSDIDPLEHAGSRRKSGELVTR